MTKRSFRESFVQSTPFGTGATRDLKLWLKYQEEPRQQIDNETKKSCSLCFFVFNFVVCVFCFGFFCFGFGLVLFFFICNFQFISIYLCMDFLYRTYTQEHAQVYKKCGRV